MAWTFDLCILGRCCPQHDMWPREQVGTWGTWWFQRAVGGKAPLPGEAPCDASAQVRRMWRYKWCSWNKTSSADETALPVMWQSHQDDTKGVRLPQIYSVVWESYLGPKTRSFPLLLVELLILVSLLSYLAQSISKMSLLAKINCWFLLAATFSISYY